VLPQPRGRSAQLSHPAGRPPTGGVTTRRRPRAEPAPAAGPEEDATSALRSGLSVLATLGPPLTILTALLFYFGWARSDQQASAMGLDVTLFGYSTQDYVLRSIRALYVPLLVIAGALTACLAAHGLVLRVLGSEARRPRLHVLGWVLLAGGLVAVGGSVSWALARPRTLPLVIPLVLAAGTAVAAYGRWLAAVTNANSTATGQLMPWQRALRTFLIGAIITLALFWELSDFAGVVGRASAQQLAASVPAMPRATAYSSVPLAIQAPGVVEETLGVAADPPAARYRTTGLRLLVRSGGRFFFVHDGWSPQSGTVIVIPDDGATRWQFSR
jgi:hypothetical protein